MNLIIEGYLSVDWMVVLMVVAMVDQKDFWLAGWKGV
jgi:hypothetical protein